MEAGGNGLFVINGVEADHMEEVPEARPVEQAHETEAEAMEHVKGLVPLCTQHPQGPQLSSATFGYDIALMAKRPWAEPGAKLNDYFNYGFNEQSWRVYCAMQESGEESLLAKATAMLQKLELAGRPAAGPVAEAGAGGHVACDEPPMMMTGGMMEGYSDGGPYGGGHNLYGGHDAPGRGGGYGRPYQPREFHPHGGGGFERPHNANYKTRLCKGFAEGYCNRGDQCNFAHGAGELRQPGAGEPMQPQTQQTLPSQQHMPQQLQSAGAAGGGSAPPPMTQGYGEHRPGYNYYAPPPPQVMAGGAPPQVPERSNYLMPPFQAGGGMPPMVGPPMSMQDSGEGAGSGFRQPPKRPRQEGGGVYEPQY